MNLTDIQSNLKVPKNQKNTYGDYNYRSCEDILEAVKPLLNGALLTLSDELVNIGDRYYIKATATLSDEDGTTTVTAYAREEETKKGMDAAQITGCASSYARKYALNGLFLIDDNKDADTDAYNKQQSKDDAPKRDPAKKITAAQAEKIGWLITDTGSDSDAFCANFKINTYADLTETQYAEAIRLFQKKMKNANKTDGVA